MTKPRERKPENIQLGAAIQRAREAANLRQEDVAAQMGVKQQSVGEWETGDSAPNAVRLQKLCFVLPRLPYELFGQPDMEAAVHEPTGSYAVLDPSAPQRFKDSVPVVGTVRAGPEKHYLELGYPTGHGDGRVKFNSRDPTAYAVRVEGESMVPRIRPGEFVIVEPAKPYRSGDDVMVSTKNGQKMVKQFLYERDGMVALDSINSVYERITLPRDQIEAIHYIVAITKSDTRELEL